LGSGIPSLASTRTFWLAPCLRQNARADASRGVVASKVRDPEGAGYRFWSSGHRNFDFGVWGLGYGERTGFGV
jgi:hypothetical protein